MSGGRNEDYGSPEANHKVIASLWNTYIERSSGTNPELDPRDVCMMMILVKVARDANKPKEDNLVDICGYALNADQIQKASEEETANVAGISPSGNPVKHQS